MYDRYLHVEITMIVSDKQDLAFRQMSTYIQRIAMMHRRNGRKTDIHTTRKKLHASSINHTTKTKSKCHRSIPSSHTMRSFFFLVIGYYVSLKAEEKTKAVSRYYIKETRRRKSSATMRKRFRFHKILLRAQSSFQLTRHVVRDISWMLTVAPIGSLEIHSLCIWHSLIIH